MALIQRQERAGAPRRPEMTEPLMTSSTTRRLTAAAAAALAVVSLAACASSSRSSSGDTSVSSAGPTGGTMVFGAAGAPKLFDPFYATDGETFRVSRQIFEGLVSFAPGTADVAPGLAKSYDSSPDGLTWTFGLQSGVTFSDGTPFNADAVCKNFTRMYSQTGAAASEAVSQYWSDNFGGFADGAKPSLYKSCTATDASTAVVTLTRVTSKFPAVLGLPSFSMQSPTAMDKYKANTVTANGDSFTYSSYALQHPTGTGPFTFESFDQASGVITLTRNENYWGSKAKLDKLVFQVIADESARKQALQSGQIDGYDLPSPADWDQLKQAGYNLEVRPAFNVLYLGVTQSNNPALADIRVRQALAYAIDRKGLVDQQLPAGATVAKEFYPDTVSGYSSDVQTYDYNPEKAKSLLAAAGATNLTVNFYWPTEVSRPYMPKPSDIFNYMQANLKAVGITVNAVSKPWNGGYLDDVDAKKADLFLLGWTGDYNTPDNFIGTFFGSPSNRFSTGTSPWGTKLAADLKAADSEPNAGTRASDYKALNKSLMADYLPAVPISHSPPALVVSSKITGLVASPLTDEKFASVSKG
jgi:peptide/nickel transport system substrate-binding protein